MITEIRSNEKGQFFAVDTTCECESKEKLIKYLKEHPELTVDKNYRISELKEK